MTKQTITSIIIIILTIAGLVFLTYWKPKNIPVAVVPNTVDVQTGPLTAIAPDMISVDEDSYLLAINGTYPQFTQADANFNKKIADIIQSETADFKQYASGDYEARLETGGEDFQKDFAQANMYTLSWNTEVIQSNDHSISVLIRKDMYAGGAHGSHVATSFNYDVKNKKELVLTDFISLEKASEQSRIQLKKIFTENGDEDTFEGFALSGTDPKLPENFQVFTFIPNSVTVYFNEYQVAPYVYGGQKVVIDLK